MKNKKILGLPITLFVIGLLVLGGASAALVTYLSNTTTLDMEVQSPFELNNAQGHVEPTSTSDTPDTGWTAGGSVDFGLITAGNPIMWTNKIRNDADVSIQVNDFEEIYGEDINNVDLTMDNLDEQFSFFGARYWRPEGSDARLDSYTGDIELGYDPYTLNTSGVITCHGQSASGYGADISGTSYVDIYDGICYYVDAAFNFNVDDGSLVSNYDYTYPGEFEELAQYVAIFNVATTPGTYHYDRQIEIPTV